MSLSATMERIQKVSEAAVPTGTLQVYSEIGRLKCVLLHRPGEEIENLTPDLMERLLFDDIPYLKIAREEHDCFARVLQQAGVEVLYLEDLAAEAITDNAVRDELTDAFLSEAKIQSAGLHESVKEYLYGLSHAEMIKRMMAGIRQEELTAYHRSSLYDQVNDEYPFVCDPMPNLYFTRDPFATIGSGITLNRMRTETRRRETLFAKHIFAHHPRFRQVQVPHWFDREEETVIEGGDELILNEHVLAMGISQRTDSASVELVSRRLFEADTSFDTVLAFDIPHSRAFMHLDTVFTMVDHDKFSIHAEIEGPLTVYEIKKRINGRGAVDLDITKLSMKLEDILARYLQRPVELIRCGKGDSIVAAREQWNDGANTLAIAPGEVVVYSRNYVTNQLLESRGIKLHVIPSSELSRGRGGPRCMSMPLYRENL